MALFCQLGSIAQCDLDLYGLELSDTDQVQIKKLSAETGELTVPFDSGLDLPNVLTGSHVLMNNIFYLVDRSNNIYSFDIKAGSLISKQTTVAKDLRFMEPDPCEALIYGFGYQSIRGPMYLNAYDPATNVISRITPLSAQLPIALDQNSKHTKLGDRYILVADDILYSIDLNIGQITNQFSVAAEGLISFVADERTGLLYGIQIISTGFALKSINPLNGEIKTIGANIKTYTGIAKSAHAISDGHYYVMIDRTYYKLDLSTGQIVDQYPIHLDIFKYVEFNHSCLPLVENIETTETSCGQSNGVISVTPLDQTSTYNYDWQGPEVNFTTDESKVIDLAPGEYNLTITSADGTCQEITTTVIDESSELEFTVDHKNLGCEGEADGEIKINAAGETEGYQYSIDNGLTFHDSTEFTGLSGGVYSIIIYGNSNCGALDTIILEEPDEIEIELQEDMEIVKGQKVMLEPSFINSHPNIELSWTSSNPQYKISCIDCENPTIQPLSNTTYYLNILDTNSGCVVVDSMEFMVRENNRDVFIPNIFSPNGDGQNDAFTFFGPDVSHINTFTIFDRWGAQVKSVTDVSPDDPSLIWDGYFNGNPIAKGSYTYLAEYRYLDGVEKKVMGQFLLVR